jgi:hypothetical protein
LDTRGAGAGAETVGAGAAGAGWPGGGAAATGAWTIWSGFCEAPVFAAAAWRWITTTL